MIHIYDGDGKGKTSAGLGALIRAHGSGMKTIAFFFLKNAVSSELSSLVDLEIPYQVSYDDSTYYWDMDDAQKQDFLKRQKELFAAACSYVKNNENRVILLDEILDLPQMGIISDDEIADLLSDCRNEIILTGRDGSRFEQMADYYSHITKVKHPYDQGHEARKGIEY